MLKGFDTVRRERDDRSGVAVLVNRSSTHLFHFVTIVEDEWKLMQWGFTTTGCRWSPVTVRLGESEISGDDWRQFFSQFGHTRAIFGSDFNAHNINWSTPFTCQVGATLWTALLDSDFSLLGDNTSTFRGDAFRRESLIDMTIVHDSLAFRLSRRIGS